MCIVNSSGATYLQRAKGNRPSQQHKKRLVCRVYDSGIGYRSNFSQLPTALLSCKEVQGHSW